MHELGHTLGLNHEHQHPERDKGIRIAVDNVKDEYKVWFRTQSKESLNTYDIPYDMDSVMHYTASVSGWPVASVQCPVAPLFESKNSS